MKIKLNGVVLNVLQRGKGEPSLLFLHYFGGSSRSWSEVIGLLEADFRCIAPDLRGFGASGAASGPFTVAQNADDIAALIEEMNLENFWLIGHSMGGKIALALAARQPRGLGGLILLAPSPPTPEPMSEKARDTLLEGHGNEEKAREILCGLTAQPLPAAILQRAIEDNLCASPAAWQAWLESGSREDIAGQMTRVQVPVEVVAGEKDKDLGAEVMEREVVSRLSSVQLHIVPECGHLLPLEEPAQIAALIRGENALVP